MIALQCLSTRSALLAGCIGLGALLGQASAAEVAAPYYAVVKHIPGSGTDWDYVSVDTQAKRLYISQGGVTALDLTTGVLTTGLLQGKFTLGVVPLGNGEVAISDSGKRNVSFFDGVTGKVRAAVNIPSPSKTPGFRDPDGMTFDAKSGLLVVVNGDGGNLVLVDPKKPAVVGTINVGSRLEFPVNDGNGMVYVNVSESHEIVTVNIAARKVGARYAMKQCENPTGLAYDQRDNLLISACENGVTKFIDAKSGKDLKTIKVGEGPDAVIFDTNRHLAFIPSGDAGTLSVIAVNSPNNIALVQTVPTQIGVRTGAVDPNTGLVYLPSAKFNPPSGSFPYPTAIKGTFELLVVGTK